jgi:hypothetical protein
MSVPNNRVKPVSRAPDKHKRIKSLECFTEVHEMVITGWALGDIAKHIQQLKGESDDITEDALIFSLGEYRKDLPPGVLVQKTLPAVFTQAVTQLNDGLDALEEMEKLYRIQMKRVNIDHAMEVQIGKLLPNMTAEIRMARDILESYAEMEMDLGLVERRLGRVDVGAEELSQAAAHYGKESVKNVLDSPQSRRKLLGLVERFMVVQQERERLKRDEDAFAAAEDEAAGLPAETEVPSSVEGAALTDNVQLVEP